MNKIHLADVQVNGGFWGDKVGVIRSQVLRYQWQVLNDNVENAEPSHCVENFRIAAGQLKGTFYGMVFQDSDLAKWLEAVAYALEHQPDPELEKLADDAIALIASAQGADGYLNTYFTVKEPDGRFTNLRDCHELYCAGHMMEAAVAYYEATGKRTLLDVMMRMARYIDSRIGADEGKLHGYPGHEEIELALMRMYGVTGEAFLMRLAGYFLHRRGTEPDYFVEEAARRGDDHPYDPSYFQNHVEPLKLERFAGHAVRALYLATGMARYTLATGDANMRAACERLFDNMTQKQMYVTGGVGSDADKERFTYDYDLPGDRAYTETCASIALCFFARQLLELSPQGRYADAMERSLYNTCLAGMALDGQHFFYVNPLEVYPDDCHRRADLRHVLPVRPRWFKCACCPPNLVRILLSLGRYAYGAKGDTAYVHLYVNGSVVIPVAGGKVSLRVETEYPREGVVKLYPTAGEYALALRIPQWAGDGWQLLVDGQLQPRETASGYAVLRRLWTGSEEIRLTLPIAPRRTYANAKLRAENGKVCIERGPLVYCLEQVDNGAELGALILPDAATLTEERGDASLDGAVRVHAEAIRELADANAPLYGGRRPATEPARLTFIPYYAWANRGENEMRVWIRSQR